MIEFRQKKTLVQDLMPKAIDNLKKEGVTFNIITPDQADSVSRVNSKAMVLVSFMLTENGAYQIQVQDKELYNYTQKLLSRDFRMRLVDIDKKNRIVTAECDKIGQVLDAITILGLKYTLSIVQ